MLTVHHLGVSQSERIVWLCEELGINYELRKYERDPVTRMAPEAYRRLHPMGIAPIITDGELVLAESGAICDYIIARHGGGRLALGPDHPNFADYLFWFHFANGTMMPNEMIGILKQMLGLADDNPMVQGLSARAARAYAMLEQRCAAATYLAGDEFTAADIMMGYPVFLARRFGVLTPANYPNVNAYLARLETHAAFIKSQQ